MGLFSWLFLLLLVHSQQLAGVFGGVVQEYALLAEGFLEGFVQACPPFAEEVLHLAEVCPHLGEEFPLLDEELMFRLWNFCLLMGINGGWRVI